MPRPIKVLSYQGQCISLVLTALYEMRGIRTKQETIAYIEQRSWFNLQPGDLEVYPSHRQASNEPRWHTLIAFGRQWAVERDLMSHYDGNDQWEISPKGTRLLESVREELKMNERGVRQAYFWSPVFKKRMCPSYEPSDSDAKRPAEAIAEYD